MEHLICPTLTALIGTAVGAVLGGYIAYLFGKTLADRQDVRQAARIFTGAFQDELRRLEADENIDTALMLGAAFTSKHERAVQEFMLHLPEKKRAELSALWSEYCRDEGRGGKGLIEYQHGDSLDERKEKRPLAIVRIRKIIEFAMKG